MPLANLVPLINLIQDPEQYDGKPVKVFGLFGIELESRALWASEADHRNSVTKNAIWLDVDSSEKNRKLHEKYVLAEGTFDMKDEGHMGMYSGTIKHVTKLEPSSAPPPGG